MSSCGELAPSADAAVGSCDPAYLQLLVTRLFAYEAALFRLGEWVHHSWLDDQAGATGAWGVDRSVGSTIDAGGGVHQAGLPARLGIALSGAEMFDDPAHRLAILPAALLCRVLRARGVLRRRPALRACLDASLRQRLEAWLHPVVYALVLREAVSHIDRDLPGLPLAPCLDRPDHPDDLAWEGFCLFDRDGVWTDPSLRRLIRLGFPLAADPPALLDAKPGAPDGSGWILGRLAILVPEAPWLCG